MNPKNVKLRYVCLNSGNVFDKVDLDTFCGLEVKYCYNRISTIMELNADKILTKISFRPTLTPVIHKIHCDNGYIQERYSSNLISKEYREDDNGMVQGEHLWYNTDSELNGRHFIHNGDIITNEVQSLIGYHSDVITDWYDHNFEEDVRFNLMIRYSMDFQFYDEYRKDNTRFDKMAEYCIDK